MTVQDPQRETERDEERKEAEAYFITIAAGIAAVGVLVLFYVATPLRSWLHASSEPVPASLESLGTPAGPAVGAYVALGPVELDFRQAAARFVEPSLDYIAYVPVRDAAGRVRLVVRQGGFRSIDDIRSTPVRAERLTGILVRGAPGLLAHVHDWPGGALRGQALADVWILLRGEHPPHLGDIVPSLAIGLAMLLVPLIVVAGYLAHRARADSGRLPPELDG